MENKYPDAFLLQRNGGVIMREVTVNYLILDEDEERLKKITEEYKKQGLNLSEDKMFEGIMCYGSKYDVDNKLMVKFKREWFDYFEDNLPELAKRLNEGSALSDDDKTALRNALESFGKTFVK